MASGLAEAGPVAFARPVPLRTSGLQARKLRPIFALRPQLGPISTALSHIPQALFACADGGLAGGQDGLTG
jgi:hypothetical protein